MFSFFHLTLEDIFMFIAFNIFILVLLALCVFKKNLLTLSFKRWWNYKACITSYLFFPYQLPSYEHTQASPSRWRNTVQPTPEETFLWPLPITTPFFSWRYYRYQEWCGGGEARDWYPRIHRCWVYTNSEDAGSERS